MHESLKRIGRARFVRGGIDAKRGGGSLTALITHTHVADLHHSIVALLLLYLSPSEFVLQVITSNRSSVIRIASAMTPSEDKKRELLKVAFKPKENRPSHPTESLKFEEPDGQQIGRQFPLQASTPCRYLPTLQ